MFSCFGTVFGLWWMFPVTMIFFCFMMMRMISGAGCRMPGRHLAQGSVETGRENKIQER